MSKVRHPADPTRCVPQRRTGRASIEAHFRPETVLDRLEEAYASLLHLDDGHRVKSGRRQISKDQWRFALAR